jgi:DhnA family fructose-bisphosphate aldolase class Ia
MKKYVFSSEDANSHLLSLSHLPNAATGHYIRLRRIFNPEDGRSVILPLDHGMSHGVLPGLEDPCRIVSDAVNEKIDAIILHAGLARRVAHLYGNHLATIFAVTSSGSALADHVLLGSVEQAVKYAADAVYVELKLGAPQELDVMRMISQVKREAEKYDLPLMVAAYVYPTYRQKVGIQSTVTACRIAGELGADIVKTSYPGDADLFAKIIAGTPAPVVIAGGTLTEEQDLFRMIAETLQIGAAGVAIGRNVWGANNPREVLSKIRSIVHGKE